MINRQYFERLTKDMEVLVNTMNHGYQVQDKNRSEFDTQALPPGSQRPNAGETGDT
jgi:hypothetical protein